MHFTELLLVEMLERDFHQILIITIDLVANTITDHIKLLFIW